MHTLYPHELAPPKDTVDLMESNRKTWWEDVMSGRSTLPGWLNLGLFVGVVAMACVYIPEAVSGLENVVADMLEPVLKLGVTTLAWTQLFLS
ncbi:hypothetical protein K2Q00_01455 [Patescibacteria group bacterium]|nr:hypothetical protein [Patescibacteria group bacterium]